ncbi:hypothetical protein L596_023432 [Steinernema carpocapsae]|uniref:T-complex protein 1 subunit alpha n=1 Tax=Steinernema carpocapsae TaxID=34508 RepID=A0A4U5MDM3_STECR|nr:hypothetical protein L596_023432 [Steinernema carpocapsae]
MAVQSRRPPAPPSSPRWLTSRERRVSRFPCSELARRSCRNAFLTTSLSSLRRLVLALPLPSFFVVPMTLCLTRWSALFMMLCVVRRVLESNKVVCGGGSVEAALNVYLEAFAISLASREQLAVAAFAEALLVIPKTLAKNAAKDSISLCGKLRSFRALALTEPKYKWAGLDLVQGIVSNMKDAGVLEPLISKIKSLKFATEAAITILRIHQAGQGRAEEWRRVRRVPLKREEQFEQHSESLLLFSEE